MARSLEWRELRTGTIAAAAITLLTLWILFFARVGALRGDTGTIYVYSDDANGVLPGTEVWLSGEKVGQVKRIRYRPVATDTLRRLSIEALIMASRMDWVRRDAKVVIRPGGNLIGTPVIYITGGTSAAPALRSGDTLAAVSSSAFKPLGARVDSLNTLLTSFADTTKRLAGMLNSPRSTLGAFQRGGLPAAPKATETMDALMRQATEGDGTLGLAMRNDLGARIGRIAAAKDSITALIASGNGTLGRFRRDSTLMKDIAAIQAQVDTLKLRFSGKGTIARAQSDSSLKVAMAKMSAELAALMADVKANPGRFITF